MAPANAGALRMCSNVQDVYKPVAGEIQLDAMRVMFSLSTAIARVEMHNWAGYNELAVLT